MNNKEQIIIGLAGRIGVGKSTIAQILMNSYGFKVLSFSNLIKKILQDQNLSIDRTKLQNTGQDIVDQLGYDGIAKLLLIENNIWGKGKYVIDGIRHENVNEYYKNKFGNHHYKLIFVYSSTEERIDRLIARGKDRINSKEDLQIIDNQKIESGIDDLLNHADFIIENNSSFDDLFSKVTNCYNSLLRE